MRLRRLSLTNWRGIREADVTFSDGVTLIEGPNEVGKSTLVEAITTLFTELASSRKKPIKSIQPVGQDVGSTVEAEITTGDYHFVYSKTYNKATQTSLHIRTPVNEQRTGREAHERVEQMLAETVDMDLWQALLVRQGERVEPAELKDLAGLSNALDEAAGSSAVGDEDVALFAAVKDEYEQHFTLKSGKSRFADLEKSSERADRSANEARTALAQVEADVDAHERRIADVNGLRARLPGLHERMEEHRQRWATIQSLQNNIDDKLREAASAGDLRDRALQAQQDRGDLRAAIVQAEQALEKRKEERDPLRTRADELQNRAARSRRDITDLRKQQKVARGALETARNDEHYLANLDALDNEQQRLEQLTAIDRDMSVSLETLNAVSIDGAGLKRWQLADRNLTIAQKARDAAATSVSITVAQRLTVEIDGGREEIEPDGGVERAVAAEMNIRIPDTATIRIMPSQSVAELQDDVDDAQDMLQTIRREFGLDHIEAATAAYERRSAARSDLDRLKARRDDLLKKATYEELEQAVASLRSKCDRYLKQRAASRDLPASRHDAMAVVAGAQADLQKSEVAADAAREALDRLQHELDQASDEHQQVQQDLAGLSARLEQRQEQLSRLRESEPDDALESRGNLAVGNVQKLDAAVDGLKMQLRAQSDSPETVQAVFENAKNAHDRASGELIEAEQALAILSDRLQQARAVGRFEALEIAERESDELRARLASRRRQAEAARLLWNTLNEHRNAARQAYVRPLKEAIEGLGGIVFGDDFEIEIDDDWSMKSQTRNGETIQFEHLSVGTREQLGILARLAAARIVSKQGGVPVIIDDALGFSDPSRLESMGAAIAAAGKHCQIILMTCTPGRFAHVGNATLVRFGVVSRTVLPG